MMVLHVSPGAEVPGHSLAVYEQLPSETLHSSLAAVVYSQRL